MGNERDEGSKRWRRLLIGGLLLFALLMLSAFWRAWSLHHDLQAKLATLSPLLAEQEAEHATLVARLTYVASDAYVEEWARVHAGMVEPGEVLVIPIAPTLTPTPTPLPTPTPTPTPLPFWQRWWRSLRGGS